MLGTMVGRQNKHIGFSICGPESRMINSWKNYTFYDLKLKKVYEEKFICKQIHLQRKRIKTEGENKTRYLKVKNRIQVK